MKATNDFNNIIYYIYQNIDTILYRSYISWITISCIYDVQCLCLSMYMYCHCLTHAAYIGWVLYVYRCPCMRAYRRASVRARTPRVHMYGRVRMRVRACACVCACVRRDIKSSGIIGAFSFDGEACKSKPPIEAGVFASMGGF